MWFFVAYFFFTLIPNKNWRYIMIVFPVLAISASDFILFLWDKAKQKLKKNLGKIVSVFFIVLLVFLIIYSSHDAYYWIKNDTVHIPVAEATQYVNNRLTSNETVMVLCPSGLFSVGVVRFYLDIPDFTGEKLWQYPEKAVDAYTPLFNETTLIERCKALHVKYLLSYEYGDLAFFQSELRSEDVLETMLDTDRFVVEMEFGTFPHRIFILQFLSNS